MTRIESNTFAAACYNMNSIDDLTKVLTDHAPGEADMIDCKAWNISPTEWREQIELALAALREDAE